MLYIAELCWGQVVKDLLLMLEQPYLSKNFANSVIYCRAVLWPGGEGPAVDAGAALSQQELCQPCHPPTLGHCQGVKKSGKTS